MSTHNRKISVVGLGYVGLPVAVAFGQSQQPIGFDINQTRINELKAGHDNTLEVEDEDLKASNILFTADPEDLRKADFHIVAVPTRIDAAKRPDLTPVIKASETVGKILKKGDIVVFESTVYPGATEEDCVPVLEKFSGLKSGEDFFVGYSPERINPGDKEHRLTSIKKVTSGSTPEVAERVDQLYRSIINAGTHKASSIRVAEAAKVIENTQRDLNIALVNELALIFSRMNIDTLDVLEAAGTKWNFLPFRPGLVGGHCIGVDPYYLTYRADQLGYHTQMISAGRRINDSVSGFVAQKVLELLYRSGTRAKNRKAAVLGLTFKENVPDLRNSKVEDLVRKLKAFGIDVVCHDAVVTSEAAMAEMGIEVCDDADIADADCVILAVPHDTYMADNARWIMDRISDTAIVIDIKSKLDRDVLGDSHEYWSL